jgi:hypothetical protein
MNPALLAALALAACAHQTPGSHPPLERALRLEMRLPDVTQRAEIPFEVIFALRNATKAPLAFCQADSGVSVALARGYGTDHVVLHGLALNPAGRCHQPTELAPGAAKEFRELVRVRAELAGPALLFGYIRVHRRGPLRNEADVPTIRSRNAMIRIER